MQIATIPNTELPSMPWRVARLAFDGVILGLSNPTFLLGGVYVVFEASHFLSAAF